MIEAQYHLGTIQEVQRRASEMRGAPVESEERRHGSRSGERAPRRPTGRSRTIVAWLLDLAGGV
jgi:hypothetical protein